MPVIRTKSQSHSTAISGTLRRELTNELRASDTSNDAVGLRQPLILENSIDATDTLEVIVIWDRWKLISSNSDRISVIRDAYAAANRFAFDRLSVVNGVTGMEAMRLGLLPYEIVFDQYVDPDQLVDAGAFESPNGPRLLLTDRSSADAVLARLRATSGKNGRILELPQE